MATGIFLIKDGKLTEMVQQQPENESVLQGLLADHPSLLAGSEMNPDVPRRFVLIGREVGLGSEEGGSGRWSVDHLFPDQDAIPTLVEVKRSSDTRIRREIIGQLIEYAANGVAYWPIEKVRADFEAQCAADGVDSDDRLREALGNLVDVDSFWLSAKDNLESGRVRMVLVGDIIPPELQRVVEFLNEQMPKAEVLAVELRYYRADNLTTLVPRVIGSTARAQQNKARRPRATLEGFVEYIRSHHGQKAALIATRIIDWSREQQLMASPELGGDGFNLWPGLQAGGASYWPICPRHDGQLFVSFQSLKSRPPFSEESLRKELLDKLYQVPGISLPPSAITGRPSISMDLLKNDESLGSILSVLSWLMQMIRKHADASISASAPLNRDEPQQLGRPGGE